MIALRAPRHLSLQHHNYSSGRRAGRSGGVEAARLAHVLDKAGRTEAQPGLAHLLQPSFTVNFKVILCSCQRVSILCMSDEKGRQAHCDLKYASPSWCECASLIKAEDPQSCPLSKNIILARCSSRSGGGGVTEM